MYEGALRQVAFVAQSCSLGGESRALCKVSAPDPEPPDNSPNTWVVPPWLRYRTRLFLSYASQDAEAAQKIAETLRGHKRYTHGVRSQNCRRCRTWATEAMEPSGDGTWRSSVETSSRDAQRPLVCCWRVSIAPRKARTRATHRPQVPIRTSRNRSRRASAAASRYGPVPNHTD